MSARSGFGKSVRVGAIAGTVIVAGAALAAAFLPGVIDRTPEKADVFVLVVAGPGEDGVTGARIVAEVDMRGARPKLSVKDPAAKAEIAGTTYDRLSDAYAFGGGAAVVGAAYRTPVPYVALDLETFSALAEDADGLSVNIPEDMDVFTGDELLTFRAGERELGGAEAIWVLEGATYLSARAENRLREQIAEEALRVASEAPGGIAGLVKRGEADSDVAPDALPAAPLHP